MDSTPGVLPRSGSVLHVGCGGDPLPPWLSHLAETRLDIDPRHKPDVVASMTDMGAIGPFDALYSSHCLEHLYPHQTHTALGEFLRVLAPGGLAVIFVPDLEDVQATDEPLYVAPCGPVTGLDLIYGFRPLLSEMPHMAHHSGFTRDTLAAAMTRAGFAPVETSRMGSHNLMGAGRRP